MTNRGLAKPKKAIATLILGFAICGPQWLCAQQPANQAKPPEAAAPGASDIEKGKRLFQGTARFANGGPSCIACHNVRNDAVAPGGTLAAELTAAISASGADGVRAMLPLAKAESPFPVMQAAYQDRRLTDDEANLLIAFLQHADQQQASQKPDGFGFKMLFAGAGGVVAMLIFFALIGQRRKKRSVNQDIYDRQLKTE